jgi:DNA-binding MarR family transcriptional regulator
MTQAPPLSGADINLAARATRSLLDVLLAQVSINFPQWIALQTLDGSSTPLDRTPLTTDLASRLELPSATIADVLGSLEQAGLITADGAAVRLTSRGDDVVKRVQAGIARIVGGLYGQFDPQELATTGRVLRAITERVPQVRATL